jgi:chitinase
MYARLCLLSFTLTAAPLSAAEPKIVGYFIEWGVYDRNYHVKDIPSDKLTHINYAFAKIVNGECALFDSHAAIDKAYEGDKQEPGALRGNFNQLIQLKKKHPHLKTLISVGGWTLSGPFSDVALTEESRAKFARSCVVFIRKYSFDGVDIDWEYPVSGGLQSNKTRKEDKANYTLLLAELRKQLDESGRTDKKHYLLTIAAPAGPRIIGNLEIDKIHKHLDWFNVMAYDFHGAWDVTTHFNAPLFAIKDDAAKDETSKKLNVDAAIQSYHAAGVPAEKIVLGVPFYGVGWGGVAKENNGLFQAKKSIPEGTWEHGKFDYRDLAKNYVGKFKRHWHDEARAPWLYDEKSGVMISYDDPESLKLKAQYARDKKLGGIMFWELSADDSKSSLLNSISR